MDNLQVHLELTIHSLNSTIVSVMTNILLIQDYIRTPKFSESGE
jgi:hypothetical protein